MKQLKSNIPAVLLVVGAIILSACGDAQSSNRRLVETGKKYFANGKYKEASLIFRKAIQKDPRFGEAYYQAGLTDLRLGRYVEALRALRRAAELQPENDDAHSKLGDLYLAIFLADSKKGKEFLADLKKLGNDMLGRDPKSFVGLRLKGYAAFADGEDQEASNAFKAASEIKPDDGPVALAYAQTLGKLGDLEECERWALAFIERNKTYAPMYDLVYLLRLKDKKVAEAEAILSRKADNNPTQAIYLAELAMHHLRNRRRDLMVETLARVTSNPKQFPNGHSMVGDFYYRIGDLDAAYKEFEKGIKTIPAEKARLEKRMAELLAMQGRNQEAIQLVDRVLQENPQDPEGKALRASLRLRGGDAKELTTALTEFQTVVAQMPENPVVRFNYGEALLARGDVEQATVQFQEAIKWRANYIAPKLALARIHLSKREYPRALALTQEITQSQPRLIEAHLLRAAALMGTQDMALARTELESILRSAPNNNHARYLLALISFSEKKWNDAETAFRAIWESNPPDSRGLFGLVEVYMSTNRVPVAKQMLERVLQTKPPNPSLIRLAIANVAVRSHEYDRAIQIYQDLVKEAPKSQNLWLRLGETQRRAQRFDEAYKTFETAKNIDPQRVTPWLYMAVVLESTAQKAKLRPVYEQILKLNPDNAVALNNLAYMLADDGLDLDQALTYAQRAKQRMPNNPDIADTLGWVYIKKNLSDDAIRIFRDLLNTKPDHVTWRFHLAMALFQKGDKLQAKKELEEALRNRPTRDEDSKIRLLLQRIG